MRNTASPSSARSYKQLINDAKGGLLFIAGHTRESVMNYNYATNPPERKKKKHCAHKINIFYQDVVMWWNTPIMGGFDHKMELVCFMQFSIAN